MPSTSSEEWQTGPGGVSFFTKRWTPEGERKAKLIFIHGFIEHIVRYDHVFSRYADAGIEVFAFDQRGFGQTAAKTKTQGKTSWVHAHADIDHFVKQEATGVSQKVFLMGHSMGGGLCFGYFTRPTPNPSMALITGGAILSGPLIQQTPAVRTAGAVIRIGSFVGAILPQLTLKVGVSPQDISRDPEIQEAYAKDPLCAPIGTFKGVSDMILNGTAMLNTDYKRYPSSLPLLAIHGTADNVTYCEATKQLIEKVQADDKEFKPFEGAYHEMHNDIEPTRSESINHVISWVQKHA